MDPVSAEAVSNYVVSGGIGSPWSVALDGGDPTLVHEGDDTSAIYVVMPMRV